MADIEYWDVYDGDRRPTGRKHQRGVPMKKGDYHIVVAVWTITFDGRLFVTKRALEKKSYPDLWENSGGCAKAGESSIDAAVRELFEETGISCDKEELTLISSTREDTAFIDTYLLRHDVSRCDIVLQKGETSDAKLVTPGELDLMIEEGLVARPIAKRFEPIRTILYEEAKKTQR